MEERQIVTTLSVRAPKTMDADGATLAADLSTNDALPVAVAGGDGATIARRSAPPYLSVENLHVQYYRTRRALPPVRETVYAVNGVSFTIERNSTFGLIGESGSGKSTIARAVLRLQPYSDGTIAVGGNEIAKMRGRRLRLLRKQVQAIFQDPYTSLNPRHSVGDIVGDVVKLHHAMRRHERNARVVELLEHVGLDREYMARLPHELSGGERQRVAIARALAVEPEMIVCDEALGALDVSIQSQVLNLLQDIQKRSGIAYLFISHDQQVIRHFTSDLGVLFMGYLVESGPTDRVFRRTAHPYSAVLLNTEPAPDPIKRERRAQLRAIYRLDAPRQSRTTLAAGCPFADHCPLVMEICRRQMPQTTPVIGGGSVRCHLHSSGPTLNGQSVLPLLLREAGIERRYGAGY